MARRSYSEEFRRQAVELYRSTPGATIQGIAADLGVTRDALSTWIKARPAAADQAPQGPPADSEPAGAPPPRRGRPAGTAARITELEAQVAALEAAEAARQAEMRKLATERDILRQAAKYFAGETNW